MKTVGIVGGIGPESTVIYYRSIIAEYRERRRDGSYPSMVLTSIDLQKMLALVAAGDRSTLVEYLAREIDRLARAGADFGLLASNTPHIVFDELAARSPILLLSIVQAAADEAKALGLARLGLFGTRFTMQGRFYGDVFTQAGISIIAPAPDEQAYIHDKYLDELVNGIVLDETREHLLAIASRMKDRDRIDGLILGGTELPFILTDGRVADVPLLDTTRIHVRRAVDELLA